MRTSVIGKAIQKYDRITTSPYRPPMTKRRALVIIATITAMAAFFPSPPVAAYIILSVITGFKIAGHIQNKTRNPNVPIKKVNSSLGYSARLLGLSLLNATFTIPLLLMNSASQATLAKAINLGLWRFAPLGLLILGVEKLVRISTRYTALKAIDEILTEDTLDKFATELDRQNISPKKRVKLLKRLIANIDSLVMDECHSLGNFANTDSANSQLEEYRTDQNEFYAETAHKMLSPIITTIEKMGRLERWLLNRRLKQIGMEGIKPIEETIRTKALELPVYYGPEDLPDAVIDKHKPKK
jgi:hypothetical protein